jgi:predicted lipid-binding transport protein (Tim44 family)
VTVFFTANLLDYTVDDKTGQVVAGDKLNPLKFQEFWTFCRDVGTSRWQLSAINQPGESPTRH